MTDKAQMSGAPQESVDPTQTTDPLQMTDKERAYAQWVTITTENIGSVPIKIKNLIMYWGKLYTGGNKDHEISVSSVEGHVINPDETYTIESCGRSDASSGTEGEFYLVDTSSGDAPIRKFYWDCPGGSKTNTWQVSGSNSRFIVESSGPNLSGGALGNIDVTVLNRP